MGIVARLRQGHFRLHCGRVEVRHQPVPQPQRLDRGVLGLGEVPRQPAGRAVQPDQWRQRAELTKKEIKLKMKLTLYFLNTR